MLAPIGFSSPSFDHNEQVFVADRYMLIPSLGFALALAVGLAQLPRLRTFTCAVVIVALSYIVPVGAMWMTGLSSSAWETGS